MNQAPQFTPQQNGLADRAIRSFKISLRNIFAATENARLCQGIPTQSVIAKNHGPGDTTGFPPALDMAGRCDVLAGYSHTAFNRDDEIDDSVTKVNSNMRNIMNARSAAISPEEKRARRAQCFQERPMPISESFFVAPSVQIALDKSWTCDYRVLAVMGINLILERAGRVFKLPKCKSRLIHDDSMDLFDSTVIPPIISDQVNKDSDVASASQPPMANEQPHLDIADDLYGELKRPEIREAEVMGDSGVARDSFNCTMIIKLINYRK